MWGSVFVVACPPAIVLEKRDVQLCAAGLVCGGDVGEGGCAGHGVLVRGRHFGISMGKYLHYSSGTLLNLGCFYLLGV